MPRARKAHEIFSNANRTQIRHTHTSTLKAQVQLQSRELSQKSEEPTTISSDSKHLAAENRRRNERHRPSLHAISAISSETLQSTNELGPNSQRILSAT